MIVFPAIEDILPHRGSMLLLDTLEDFNQDEVRCRYTPRFDAWYADAEGTMPAWFGIEIMAQAIAAHVGMSARMSGRPPRLGALLGTRSYVCDEAAFPPGQALTVFAQLDYRDETGLASYTCRIERNARKIASARLNAYEPDDFAQFLSMHQNTL